MNLPYSYSIVEKEEGVDLELQIVAEIEGLPSLTPKEQDEPTEKDSSSNPKTQRINQLLRQVYEMEISKREIKKNNSTLTRWNKLLHNSYLEMRERYVFLKRLNKRYLKDNTRLYRMIRLQRLQVKDEKPNPSTHLTLETLVEGAISLQPRESSQAVVILSNIEPDE